MSDYRPGSFTRDAASPATDLTVPQGANRSPASFDACLRAIERVAEVVEQETFALERHQRSNLGDFNHRKSHGLLELTRAFRALGPAGAGQGLEPRLRALDATLKRNAAVLRMHLEAVQEVSTVMARAIRDGESDGTYSAAIRTSGGRG